MEEDKKRAEKRKESEETFRVKQLRSNIAYEEAEVMFQKRSYRAGHEERLARHEAKLKELNEKLQKELAKPPRPLKRQKREEGEQKPRTKPIKARASDGEEHPVPVKLCRKFFKLHRDKFAFSKDLPTWDDLTTDGHRNEVIGEFLKVYDFHSGVWELKADIEERKKRREEEEKKKEEDDLVPTSEEWRMIFDRIDGSPSRVTDFEANRGRWLREIRAAMAAAPHPRLPVWRSRIPPGCLSWSDAEFNEMRPRLCDGCVGLPGFEHVCDLCASMILKFLRVRQREIMDRHAAEAIDRWGERWGVQEIRPVSAAAAAAAVAMARPIPPTSSTLVKECTVCTESRPHDVLVPCGHVVVCRECVVHPQFDGKCPTCRVKIEKYQPVFLS